MTTSNRSTIAKSAEKYRLFISYGRKDAAALANRMAADLTARGYEVWLDTRDITPGRSWQHEIVDGLRSAQLVIALMSPHSVRQSNDPRNPDRVESVCLGEINYALFHPPSRPVVPVMAVPCEPPLAIYHLSYVDLTRWAQSAEDYHAGLARLESSIDRIRSGERVAFRRWYDELRPWDFSRFIHEKRRNFTGRQWLLDEIDAWRASSQNERALLITGDPGTGKSAVVAELVHRNPGGQVIAYHCCQWHTQATLEPWRFVRSIAAMIASRLPYYEAQLELPAIKEILSEASCRTDPGSAFVGGVLSPLESVPAPAEGVRYLLIDALDEAFAINSSFTLVDLLASRLEGLPAWLRIVATTRKEPKVLRQLRGLRAQELDTQDPRNRNDVDAYIRRCLETPNFEEKLTQLSARHRQSRLFVTEQVVQTLLSKCDGNFLYIRQAIDGIESGMHSLERLNELPPRLTGLYEEFFKRQFGASGESYGALKPILEAIVAARDPLTAEQLAAATGLDVRREMPSRLNQLAAFLPPRLDADGRATFAVFHKSLGDWLTSDDLLGSPFGLLVEDGHARLAAMGWAECREISTMSDYSLRHLPAHLIGARRWNDLINLLMEVEYLEVKAAAGRVFELAHDLTMAWHAIPATEERGCILELLDKALRREIHFIHRNREGYGQGLFQCLWNFGWWYDCPEAARHYDQPEGGWPEPPPWRRRGPKLCDVLQRWRSDREPLAGLPWLRALRPPSVPLGTGQLGVLRGHDDSVKTVGYSPDGSRIASGSNDKTVRVWDAATGAQLAVLHGHEHPVECVAYSPDGTQIVSGSYDKTVRVWDAATGAQLAILRGHGWRVTSVSYSPDGARIASGSDDKTVRVWDAASGTELAVLRGHEGRVTSVSYAADSVRIVSGSSDKSVRVWNGDTGTQLAMLTGHENLIQSVSCSGDGTRIVSGSFDRTVRVWDATTGEQLNVLCGHTDLVTTVSFSRDDARIASGSYDKTVRTWDAATGAQLSLLRGHEWSVESVSYAPDSSRIVSASTDNTVRVWDGGTAARSAVLRGHEDYIRSASYSRDGTRIASGSDDNTVRVWNSATGEPLGVLRGHGDSVACVGFSPDGMRIVSGSLDLTVRVWSVITGAPLMVLRGHADLITCVTYSPQGTQILSGSWDKTLRLWNAVTGGQFAVLRGHTSQVQCASFSPDGGRIASGSNDGTVRVWNATTGDQLAVLWGHENSVHRVSYSPDGSRIVSGSLDKTSRVWDAESGDCLEIIQDVDDVAAIAAGSETIRQRVRLNQQETLIEDAETGQIIARFPEPLSAIVAHPEGRRWAGGFGAYLCIIELDGVPDSLSRLDRLSIV